MSRALLSMMFFCPIPWLYKKYKCDCCNLVMSSCFFVSINFTQSILSFTGLSNLTKSNQKPVNIQLLSLTLIMLKKQKQDCGSSKIRAARRYDLLVLSNRVNQDKNLLLGPLEFSKNIGRKRILIDLSLLSIEQ